MMNRWIGLTLCGVSMAFLIGSCSSEAVEEIREGCETPGAYDIASVYSERFNCDEQGTCVDQDESAFILIRRDEGDTDESDGTDYTFCDTPETGVLCNQEPNGELSWSGSGTLCGETFAWTAVAPERYTEAGIWTFANQGDTFVKTSDYRYVGGAGGGLCTGTGQRGYMRTPFFGSTAGGRSLSPSISRRSISIVLQMASIGTSLPRPSKGFSL